MIDHHAVSFKRRIKAWTLNFSGLFLVILSLSSSVIKDEQFKAETRTDVFLKKGLRLGPENQKRKRKA